MEVYGRYRRPPASATRVVLRRTGYPVHPVHYCTRVPGYCMCIWVRLNIERDLDLIGRCLHNKMPQLDVRGDGGGSKRAGRPLFYPDGIAGPLPSYTASGAAASRLLLEINERQRSASKHQTAKLRSRSGHRWWLVQRVPDRRFNEPANNARRRVDTAKMAILSLGDHGSRRPSQ